MAEENGSRRIWRTGYPRTTSPTARCSSDKSTRSDAAGPLAAGKSSRSARHALITGAGSARGGWSKVRCPWPHACFNLRARRAFAAPAPNDTLRWPIERRDGHVFVHDRISQASPRLGRDCRKAVNCGLRSRVDRKCSAACCSRVRVLNDRNLPQVVLRYISERHLCQTRTADFSEIAQSHPKP